MVTQYATSADAIRAELQSLRDAGTLGEMGADMENRYESAAALVDRLAHGMQEATLSQRYTSVGLAELSRQLSQPLMDAAARFDREGGDIEARLTTEANVVWDALHRAPTSDTERSLIADRQARLEREDPAVLEGLLTIVAEGGNDDLLLRAALQYPNPPSLIDAGKQRWRPLLRPDFVEKLRCLVADRTSPLGPRAWRARCLHGLAAKLRQATGWQS